MVLDKEIQKLIKPFLGPNEVIQSIEKDDGFIYVFICDRNFIGHEDDERYKKVGGRGPIKINIHTKECEEIHYLDFPQKRNETSDVYPSNLEIEKGIKKRKFINEEDIFYFMINTFNSSSPKGLTFLDFGSNIEIHFNEKGIANKFKLFFDSINACFVIKESLKLIVKRELD